MKDIHDYSAEFRRFSRQQEAKPSPLYTHIAAQIASDPGPLLPLLAAIPPLEQAPNLLFASVHFLLKRAPEQPLATYYASIHKETRRDPDAHAFILFRDFCKAQHEEISNLLLHRRTQTNEPRRGLALLPAIHLAGQLAGGRPLTLVEIGCSAGLNLLFDQYGYRYIDEQGDEYRAGMTESPLQLDARLCGRLLPPLKEQTPIIAKRLGIDLAPVDLHNSDDISWLEALVWPEHHDRREHLKKAVVIARDFTLNLYEGDALALLPRIAASLDNLEIPVFYHTYVWQQLRAAQRKQLSHHIAQSAHRFPQAFHLWHERGPSLEPPKLSLRHFAAGEMASERLLAHCGAHVRWLKWQDQGSGLRLGQK